MKKEFEIYQDNMGNVYTITTELEELLLKDIVKLHSIIKEVREYIKDKWEIELKDSMEDFLEHDELVYRKRLLHILEILDKENK